MADVQVNQPSGGGSAAGWIWAIVGIIVIALLLWFFLGGGLGGRKSEVDVDINAPTGGSGGGQGGSGGTSTELPRLNDAIRAA